MNPRRSNSSLPQLGRSAHGVATAAVLLLIPVIVLLGGDGVREFLDFGAGVLSLVALSCSVAWGLVATDRLFLNARQRLVAQAVHRATAISSVAFLFMHVTVKLALDHTSFLSVVIPFSLGVTGTGALIGFGSLAALLMIITAVTGALRSAFASPAPVAARWRMFHMLAYPAWCLALVHGLYAGREAQPVYITMYSLCLVGVAGALSLRSAPRPLKRKVADRVLAILGTEVKVWREELDASRARNTENPFPDARTSTGAFPRVGGADARLPGMGGRSMDPLEDTRVPSPRTPSPTGSIYDVQRADVPDSSPGFAAAYRAVSASPWSQDQQMPDLAQPLQTPRDMQPMQPMPLMDDGSTTGSTRWPAPSPPPVGEAPPSAYDPMQDTFAGQSYAGQSYAGQSYLGESYNGVPETSYGTIEANAPYGTYNPNNTYNSGPATETLPGSYDYDPPGSGEPWNAPSGGFK